MIKLEHVVLPSPEQMEFVIEGMRNAHDSWDKSDSGLCSSIFGCDNNDRCFDCFYKNRRISGNFAIGTNDRALMNNLSGNGPVHSKYMRMMPVMLRITAPLYWWKEFDTYKVGTVSNSCSTMHRIHAKEFILDDFSHDHMTPESITLLEDVIIELNALRNCFLGWKELAMSYKAAKLWEDKKDVWWQMIQLLPSSYNQTRNIMLDYEVLKNIYTWRKAHKLDEWVEFCKWIETLPYSEIITGGNNE